MVGRDLRLDGFVGLKGKRGAEEEMVSILKELGVECARKIEEDVDPQFNSLRRLYDSLGDGEPFLKLVIANSIVSYQLTARGEDWWNEFSEHFSGLPPGGLREGVYREYERFLPASMTNRRLVTAKVERLRKLEPLLSELSLEELRELYMENMDGLRFLIARTLGSSPDSKTVVFSVKMFGYGGRIVFRRFVPYPMSVPIPLDSRIKRYTLRLTSEPPVKFWMRVAVDSNVPPLHIDSILWSALGGREEVLKKLKRVCGREAYEKILKLLSVGDS